MEGHNMNFKETFEDYIKVKNEISILKKKEEELKKELMKIPANKTKNGILHGVTIKKTAKYSDVVDKIIEMFVPKSKRTLAYQLIEDSKTESQTHSFEVIK